MMPGPSARTALVMLSLWIGGLGGLLPLDRGPLQGWGWSCSSGVCIGPLPGVFGLAWWGGGSVKLGRRPGSQLGIRRCEGLLVVPRVVGFLTGSDFRAFTISQRGSRVCFQLRYEKIAIGVISVR